MRLITSVIFIVMFDFGLRRNTAIGACGSIVWAGIHERHYGGCGKGTTQYGAPLRAVVASTGTTDVAWACGLVPMGMRLRQAWHSGMLLHTMPVTRWASKIPKGEPTRSSA